MAEELYRPDGDQLKDAMGNGLILVAALFLAAAAPAAVREPPGLWQGAMHGETPDTVKGARVIDAEALVEMREHGHPVLLDVAEREQKPSSTTNDMPWMPTHRTIPGAVWLAGAGSGTSDPAFARAFNARIAELAGNDLNRQIVVFCHPHCWGSWNASRRLVDLGYKNVHWYPGGVQDWQSAHDTNVVKPDPVWQNALANPARVEAD
jgi:PQQ-dependent catabolism-associated CXXCW motif protein